LSARAYRGKYGWGLNFEAASRIQLQRLAESQAESFSSIFIQNTGQKLKDLNEKKLPSCSVYGSDRWPVPILLVNGDGGGRPIRPYPGSATEGGRTWKGKEIMKGRWKEGMDGTLTLTLPSCSHLIP